MRTWTNTLRSTAFIASLLLALSGNDNLAAQPVVPGSGHLMNQVGDDFEDPNWNYNFNLPKSSRNIDEKERGPLGRSQNGRWLEGPHRGTPDVLQRVPTPEGGLEGSMHSLLMRSLRTGIPNQITYKPQQDDIMIEVKRRIGNPIPVGMGPNCVVRVYVPPFEEWENRSGASFGFRTDLWGSKPGKFGTEQYWPGIFINFRSETTSGIPRDSAYLTVRGDRLGRDVRSLEVRPGWWTLGMSVTGDGMCHFYAKEGLDDLTPADHIGSHYCYGFRAQKFELFFFNVVAFDNGKTWSTPWIIDDPKLYTLAPVATRNRSSRRLF